MTDVTDLHIVAVDDEPANVLLLKRILEAAGYRHVSATSKPREALVYFTANEPDLLLLD